MKDTIRAKIGYWLGSNAEIREKFGLTAKALLDGQEVVMICQKASLEEYEYNKRENECFTKCEVFTTQKGNQYIYWRDEELDIDYITKIAR